MKKAVIALLCLPLFAWAQKNVNGKVYDKHPAIGVVDAFHEAYASGDVDALKSLVSDDFLMWDSMSNNPNKKPRDFNALAGRVNYMKNNFEHVSIKDRGSAYSDAIEFKDSGVYVMTYKMFTAWDKNNGFKIKTPLNATYIFDESGKKIKRMLYADNKAAWQKWSLSNETISNGIIYKDHENIRKVRKVYYHLENGSMEGTFKDFTKNARIYDSNLVDKEYNNLEDHMANAARIFSSFEILSIDEVGYPDYLDYEGNGGVAMSWNKFILKNNTTGKIVKMPVHSQMWFNEEGKIVREDLYYNANLLE